jgi:hypothetical protein
LVLSVEILALGVVFKVTFLSCTSRFVIEVVAF